MIDFLIYDVLFFCYCRQSVPCAFFLNAVISEGFMSFAPTFWVRNVQGERPALPPLVSLAVILRSIGKWIRRPLHSERTDYSYARAPSSNNRASVCVCQIICFSSRKNQTRREIER